GGEMQRVVAEACAERETSGCVGGPADTSDADADIAAAEHRRARTAAAAVTKSLAEDTGGSGAGRAAHADAANAAADGPGSAADEPGDAVAAGRGGTEHAMRAIVGAEGHPEQAGRGDAAGEHAR